MRILLFPLILAVLLGHPAPARAQTPVFDAANFRESALIDAHAVAQIGNQVRQLQNEAQMLLRLEQNLRQLGISIAPDLQRALSALQGRLASGGGMGLRLTGAGCLMSTGRRRRIGGAGSGGSSPCCWLSTGCRCWCHSRGSRVSRCLSARTSCSSSMRIM